ncbi:hypothetical protein G3601_005208 [Salmonella enterica]|uniref:Uncharacterized protein n=4 Tax=Salmonella enterica TaxID=28901 RepID=A0A3Z6QTY8_SALEB|nr:hypothetical protein [Salmonella enterica subsp. enterica serovar Java]EAN9729177.1 hypothetical protein [Salmonella enterica]EBV8394921.1 hypothetical protein [Salmonella enterica subsp. enterica serovar Virchow]ECA3795555.1 hypothetical protein [Salmonella enterica subsp. enterica serovar Aqua]EDQ0183474.1 hypothetical protein [Salmonella enterica subsp. enterica serovar 4,[5],12:b:-]EDV9618131.1 hypothetical protein [Salmonella enterica subsp. enterica serovar Paratyphi B]EHF6859229.1 h
MHYGISDAIDSSTFLMKLPSVKGSAERGGTGWTDNRRVVFWVWLYLKKSSYLKLGLFDNNSNSCDCPYRDYQFPDYADSHVKRCNIIHRWFNKMTERFGKERVHKLACRIEYEWVRIFSTIKPPYKISETNSDSIWCWRYIKKKKSFRASGLTKLNPQTHSERILFINAVFDIPLIEDDFDADIKLKDILFNRLEQAFYKQRSRKVGTEKGKERINVAVTPETKRMLKEISEREGRNLTVIIERLIAEKHAAIFKYF